MSERIYQVRLTRRELLAFAQWLKVLRPLPKKRDRQASLAASLKIVHRALQVQADA